MSKISYHEYQSLLLSDEVEDEKILEYSKIVKGASGSFDWTLQPDPEKVEVSQEELEAESAMQIGNSLCRWRRARRYFKRKKNGVDLPVLVSEGDSWFQFPFLIKEVIDQLENHYLIWSVGAAGDTAENMVFGQKKKKKTEYMRALRARKNDNVQGFLFSAAGNDIIGEDPDTGNAALFDILKDYNGDDNDVHGHINFAELGQRMTFLRQAYTQVIDNIRAEDGFEQLPVFIHGYDYPFPYPFGNDDPRDPSYAKRNEWLGEPLDKRNIPQTSTGLRRNIIKVLIDTLYDMLNGVAGNSNQTKVWVVDCRGAMPNVTDWNDEIHGTSQGFEVVGRRFTDTIIAATGVGPR